MATVLLGIAGASLGGIFGPIGVIVGRAAGALVGSMLDQAIVSALTPPMRREGPRLTTTDIQTSTEGSPMNRVYGRARTAGQVIWATRFEEEVTTERQGGKGFGGPKIETTTYTYYGNFAVGLCEGPVAGIGRIWADGKEVDQTEVEFRVYLGTESQQTDPLIEAKEKSAPAYRGVCYIVFERLDLTQYGNRLPQVTAEVFRPVGDLEPLIEAVALIPGNEHGLDTTHVYQVDGPSENRHTLVAATDLAASIDRLMMLCPSIRHVMLVVSWFGDDLRAGSCTLRPKIEAIKNTEPHQWRVSGLTRDTALVVTYVDGKPAYGGTPDDASVIRGIQELTSRGLEVCYCPFIMMDVAPDNALPNPYTDNAAGVGQPAFPWRGRITCSPAPGLAGSPDKTSTAADQVAAFVGSASAAHFGGSGTTVSYSGPAEWSFRRFILHNAKLAQLAGGVEVSPGQLDIAQAQPAALDQARVENAHRGGLEAGFRAVQELHAFRSGSRLRDTQQRPGAPVAEGGEGMVDLVPQVGTVQRLQGGFVLAGGLFQVADLGARGRTQPLPGSRQTREAGLPDAELPGPSHQLAEGIGGGAEILRRQCGGVRGHRSHQPLLDRGQTIGIGGVRRRSQVDRQRAQRRRSEHRPQQ